MKENQKMSKAMKDAIIKVTLENVKMTEMFLQEILKIEKLAIESIKQFIEDDDDNPIKVDICATDGTISYDIEVLQANDRSFKEYLRICSSLFDADIINRGRDILNPHKTVLIFLLDTDIFELGLSVYHIRRKIKETGEYYDDNLEVICLVFE